jgi:Lrp/AsnC family transcriptional regulator
VRPGAPGELDRTDRRILAIIQEDSTLPLAEIGARVGLSQTPCWKRIQRLERNGVIRRRVALIDAARVDLGLTAFVSVQVAEHVPDRLAGLHETIAAMPEVLQAFRLAGDVDYLLRVVVRSTTDFDAFYRRLIAVVPAISVTSRFVMEPVKDSTALPLNADVA